MRCNFLLARMSRITEDPNISDSSLGPQMEHFFFVNMPRFCQDRYLIRMLLPCMCIFLSTFRSEAVSLKPGSPIKNISSAVLTLNAPTPRKVQIYNGFHLWQRAISSQSGEPIYGGHAQLWIDGTETDGPLLVELGFNPKPPPAYAIRLKDLGVANTGKPFTPPLLRPGPYQMIQFINSEGET